MQAGGCYCQLSEGWKLSTDPKLNIPGQLQRHLWVGIAANRFAVHIAPANYSKENAWVISPVKTCLVGPHCCVLDKICNQKVETFELNEWSL